MTDAPVDPTAARAVRLAQRLREMRERAGLSARQLGRAACMPRETVHRLERGAGMPSVTTLCRLADALEVEPSELLCVLDSRWAMTEAWRADRLADGRMALVATPREEGAP
jgi:transcriptional regulator with XRE-family HTH domain